MSQKDIENWWDRNPMTYADTHGDSVYHAQSIERGTIEFFKQIDERLYEWNRPLHRERPFDKIFPYCKYSGARILEVGCGMGAMAMNWALSGARVTAVDLNREATIQTRKRFELCRLDIDVMQSDARNLPFSDGTFDYVYSWGVLHHSPDSNRSFSEVMRVLKPGGGFGFMIYNRRSFQWWYMTKYLEGFLHMENRHLDDLQLASRYGDGHREEGNPHTWPMTKAEVEEIFRHYSQDLDIDVLGTDLVSIFKYMLPGPGMKLPGWAIKPWARRFGWSLWIHGHKNT